MDTQVLRSYYKPLAVVQLPEPRGRQFYMHTLDLEHPSVPEGFEDYLDAVCRLTGASGCHTGEAYLTIDEKIVKAGMSQRRPRPHVDGCFKPEQMQWGGGGGGAWLHYCNDVGASAVGRMAVIVAASVAGCRAWAGEFIGRPAKDGDLSHIADQLGEGRVLPANVGYLLSPDCVHESMILDEDTPRTFLRIAMPSAFRPNFPPY